MAPALASRRGLPNCLRFAIPLPAPAPSQTWPRTPPRSPVPLPHPATPRPITPLRPHVAPLSSSRLSRAHPRPSGAPAHPSHVYIRAYRASGYHPCQSSAVRSRRTIHRACWWHRAWRGRRSRCAATPSLTSDRAAASLWSPVERLGLAVPLTLASYLAPTPTPTPTPLGSMHVSAAALSWGMDHADVRCTRATRACSAPAFIYAWHITSIQAPSFQSF